MYFSPLRHRVMSFSVSAFSLAIAGHAHAQNVRSSISYRADSAIVTTKSDKVISFKNSDEIHKRVFGAIQSSQIFEFQQVIGRDLSPLKISESDGQRDEAREFYFLSTFRGLKSFPSLLFKVSEKTSTCPGPLPKNSTCRSGFYITIEGPISSYAFYNTASNVEDFLENKQKFSFTFHESILGTEIAAGFDINSLQYEKSLHTVFEKFLPQMKSQVRAEHLTRYAILSTVAAKLRRINEGAVQ